MLVWLCGKEVTGCCNCDEFAVLVPSLLLTRNGRRSMAKAGDEIEKEWEKMPITSFSQGPKPCPLSFILSFKQESVKFIF